MEYIDILDQNGKATGENREKKIVHEKGLWHKTVHVWVINSKNELLVQKRAACKGSYPNLWDISAAGHIDAGENNVFAAVREVKEELGLEITKNELKYLFTVKSQSTEHNNTYLNNEFQDVYLVKRDLDFKKLILQKEEVAEVKFIGHHELEKIAKTKDRSYVAHSEEYTKLLDYIKQNSK